MNEILAYLPAWNGWLALLLYWAPLVLCALGYSVRGVRAYRKELAGRARAEADPKAYYYPSLTVGDLVGHVFVVLCPVVNLGALFFDVGGEMIRHFFWTLGKLLDIPLVPRVKKQP